LALLALLLGLLLVLLLRPVVPAAPVPAIAVAVAAVVGREDRAEVVVDVRARIGREPEHGRERERRGSPEGSSHVFRSLSARIVAGRNDGRDPVPEFPGTPRVLLLPLAAELVEPRGLLGA